MQRLVPRPAEIVRWGAIGILLGTAAHSFFFDGPAFLGWCAVCVAAAAAFRRTWILAIAVCGFAFGWLRFAGYIVPVQRPALALTQVERVRGYVRTVTKSPHGQTILFDTLTRVSDAGAEAFPGTVVVAVPPYPEFVTGEAQEVLCAFREARPPFVSLMRRVRHRVLGFCETPLAISRIAKAGRTDRFLTLVRQKIASGVGRSLPSPHAELAAGILFGATQITLPTELLDAFRRTGTAHIVAASGYNVSVVSSWFLAFAFLCRCHRRWAFLLSFGLVWLYVCVAGFGASLCRAALMISAVLAARMLGRESRTTHALLLTAAGMVCVTPTLLGFDIGFQLTVAATVGLVLLGPLVAERCAPWCGVSPIAKLFSETLAVFFTTTPMLLWHFGTFSAISLLANLLIVPLVPLVMLLSAVALVGTMLLPAAAAFFGLLSWAPLSYLIGITQALASLPYASVSIGSFSFVGVLGWYGVVLLFFHPSLRTKRTIDVVDTNGWEVIGV